MGNFDKKVQVAYQKVLGMAFSRSSWIDKARKRLEGALGEYAKKRYADLIDFDYDWSPEILDLLDKVHELFDSKVTKLKSGFDLNKAFTEAFTEASSAQEQLLDARNDFLRKYLTKKEDVEAFLAKTRTTKFRSEHLLADMLKEFAPELLGRL